MKMPQAVIGLLPEPADVPTPATTEVTSAEARIFALQRFAATPQGRAALEAEIAARLRTETARDLALLQGEGGPRADRRKSHRRLLKMLTKARRAKA